MRRQAAFIDPKPMLKGALHCHTTRSDGRGTPEEVLRKHEEHGYAFVAITDHRIYNHKNYAPETSLLIVPGMEMDANFYGKGGVHCFHTVCIGPASEDGNRYHQDQKFDLGSNLVADQFDFQRQLDQWHADGQMTIYCHPEWSFTKSSEFDQLKGNFAMEIWNSGCAMENELDTNAAYWDDLLYQNQKIFGVAVDDGHAMNQHCVGWVMVNAEKSLPAILAALKEGAFYSSCGPEIKDFYVKDGKAVVECSPCESIALYHAFQPTRFQRGEGGGLITRAEFELYDFYKYARVAVKDDQGKRAWTNPIFLDK